MLKAHPRLLEESVHFNMEADSLNCCVLGTDVTPSMPEFDILLKKFQEKLQLKRGKNVQRFVVSLFLKT
jgi:oxepin-CoA hydrolase/3-oxo-5,6-dehydrosuberyl-CoA semialdehyde dehydrogenase